MPVRLEDFRIYSARGNLSTTTFPSRDDACRRCGPSFSITISPTWLTSNPPIFVVRATMSPPLSAFVTGFDVSLADFIYGNLCERYPTSIFLMPSNVAESFSAG